MGYLQETTPDNFHLDLEAAKGLYPVAREGYDELYPPWEWSDETDLGDAFSWKNTPQGFEFWDALYARIAR